MKTVAHIKIMIVAIIGALLCTGCVVHRDHPKPPHHKKHKPKKKKPHKRPPHPHGWADASQPGGTFYHDGWLTA